MEKGSISNNNVWISVACSAVALASVAIAYHRCAADRTRGTKLRAHLIYLAVLVGLMFVPTSIASYMFTALTVTTVGTIFPIYESVRSICTPEEDDDKAWLVYWQSGGVLFILTEYVNDFIKSETVVTYWYQTMFFVYVWLFFPKTDGAALIYDKITEPFISPRVRPLAAKMNNAIQALYQTLVNAAHLWLLWIIFLFLPATLKRLIAVAIGTVYPLVSSITASATEEVEDDTYWLTYWSCYGCLFLIMELLETWLGWIPGFYTLVIFSTVYLMLPMFQGADKVFRKVLVPLTGLQELLMLRDAIAVKKRMLKDLDPDRARIVRKTIAKFYDDDDNSADASELKKEMLQGWAGIKMPTFSNPFSSSSAQQKGEEGLEPNERTPIV